MFSIKSGSLKIGNTDMDYISFGKGSQPFIILPGLGDALKTVKGAAFPIAMMYQCFSQEYRVVVFSRKNHLPDPYSIQDMANDQAQAMTMLGIANAYMMGISQGGMIAMHLAAEHPELVEKLILANTAASCNDTMQHIVSHWLSLAQMGDYKSLFVDTAENTYTEKKLKLCRPLYPVLSAISKPKSLVRFTTQANACLCHNANKELERIKCSTLVIGGDSDKIVGAHAAFEIANGIENSELAICKGYGHGAYKEDSTFNRRVMQFLRK